MLASIERHRLTCGWMAPVMLNRVLTVPDPGPLRPGYLRLVHRWRRKDAGVAQSAISRAVFTRCRFVDGFGMTKPAAATR